MDLRELRVQRLPGITQPFTLKGVPGLNLVLGPNGSGKSSLCRATLGLLWPRNASDGTVEAVWEDQDTTWLASREAGGRVHWQRDGRASEGPELPAATHATAFHLGVLDLLKPAADAGDAGLARAVRRQLAGGYDLAALRAREVVSGREGEKERRQLTGAEAEVQRWRGQQQELAVAEGELAELRSRRQAARAAAIRERALTAAIELLEAREAADAAREQVDRQYPPTMATLRADDHQRLQGLREQQQILTRELATEREVERAAEHDLAATGLTEPLPERARLTAVRDTLERARAHVTRGEAVAAELAGAEAALAETVDALAPWGEPPADGPLDPADLRAETTRAAQVLTVAARRDATRDLLDHEALQTDISGDDPAVLARARRALLDWLAAVDERRPAWPALLAGVGLLVAGLWRRPWLDDWPGWLMVAGGAVAMAWPLLRLGRRPRSRRARADLAATGVVAALDGDDVATRRLLDEVLDRDLGARHRDLVQGLRRRLETSAARAEDELAGFADDENAPVQRVDTVERLHRAAAYHGALRRRDELAASHASLADAAATARNEAAAALATWLADTPPRAGITELAARIDDLAERRDAHVTASAARDASRRRQADLARQAAQRQREAAELLAGHDLGPDDDEILRQRVARLPAYRSLAATAERAAADLRARQADLERLPGDARAPAHEALEKPLAVLREERDESHDLAASHDPLNERILHIEGRLGDARRQAELDRAVDARDDARDDLVDVRAIVRERALRQLLLARLQAQHRRLAEPPVLRRARDLLLRFTQGAYELMVGDDDSAGFRALDRRTRRGLALAELSDGTRAQLLLAARLAYLAEAERGVRLPLFLDESLTASDPQRFSDAAGAVLDLVADESRQVFYLTCDPADVAAWQDLLAARGLPPAPVVDLASLRQLAAGAPAGRLRPEVATTPPPAAGEDATTYARRLGVPALDPHTAAHDAHLFHLLRDDLELLHALLRRGVERLGQLEAIGDVLEAESLLTPDRAQDLAARGRALVAFLEAFATGRGRPVPPGEVTRASGIKSTKLPEVDALLNDLGGDASALLAAIGEQGIKNFRESKQAELEGWLLREGHLDPRPRLGRDAVTTEVMRSVRDDVAAGRLRVVELRELIAAWWVAAGG